MVHWLFKLELGREFLNQVLNTMALSSVVKFQHPTALKEVMERSPSSYWEIILCYHIAKGNAGVELLVIEECEQKNATFLKI